MLQNKFFFFFLFFVIIEETCYAQKPPLSANDKPQAEAAKTFEVFVYDSKGKRDPFLPLVTADGRILEPDSYGASEGSIKIEGIIYDPGGLSYAIVNAAIVKAGDWVGSSQVLEIQPKKIIFIKDNQKTEIGLREEK